MQKSASETLTEYPIKMATKEAAPAAPETIPEPNEEPMDQVPISSPACAPPPPVEEPLPPLPVSPATHQKRKRRRQTGASKSDSAAAGRSAASATAATAAPAQDVVATENTGAIAATAATSSTVASSVVTIAAGTPAAACTGAVLSTTAAAAAEAQTSAIATNVAKVAGAAAAVRTPNAAGVNAASSIEGESSQILSGHNVSIAADVRNPSAVKMENVTACRPKERSHKRKRPAPPLPGSLPPSPSLPAPVTHPLLPAAAVPEDQDVIKTTRKEENFQIAAASTVDVGDTSFQNDDDDDLDDDQDKTLLQSCDPERLKAFNMFVRLFVDENLDRVAPISKQPKEKIQAILEACDRQFPEFHSRSRKRVRTYLKSCRRLRRTKETSDGKQARPVLPHLTSTAAETILARACDNEGNNAKRMRMGLEPLPASEMNSISPCTVPDDLSMSTTSAASKSCSSSSSSSSSAASPFSPASRHANSARQEDPAQDLSAGRQNSTSTTSSTTTRACGGRPTAAVNADAKMANATGARVAQSQPVSLTAKNSSRLPAVKHDAMETTKAWFASNGDVKPIGVYIYGGGGGGAEGGRGNGGRGGGSVDGGSMDLSGSVSFKREVIAGRDKGYSSTVTDPLSLQNGPTDLSIKKSSTTIAHPSPSSSLPPTSVAMHTRSRLNCEEIAAIKQLIAGYRESAAFLSRSADELQQVILQNNNCFQ